MLCNGFRVPLQLNNKLCGRLMCIYPIISRRFRALVIKRTIHTEPEMIVKLVYLLLNQPFILFVFLLIQPQLNLIHLLVRHL